MACIGIISDTHEHIRMIVKAVEMLKQENLDLVIHCGDIISPPVLERFSGLPMRFVFGNNDGERFGLKRKCEELGFGHIDDFLSFTHSEKSFFVYHGTSRKTLDETIASQKYDFVLTGHTHVTRDETIGRTRVINPGALFAAERYTFAILEPASGKLVITEVGTP